jgi:type IV secretory pathway VirB2 component (pilin)
MSKFSAKIFEAFTGATAFATLLASRTFAVEESTSIQDSPLQKGVDVMHADGMPTQIIGVDGTFNNIINTILYVAGIVAVAMLIIGGIRFMVSRGDKDKVQKAKNTVIYAIIGLVLVIFSYAIVNFIISATGKLTA